MTNALTRPGSAAVADAPVCSDMPDVSAPPPGVGIGVVGVRGAWSTETLLDAIAARTGYRRLVVLEECHVDFDSGRVWHEDLDLGTLDALLIRKLGREHGPAELDRLALLEHVRRLGTRVLPEPSQLLPLTSRLRGTAVLRSGRIPMPTTVVTECAEQAVRAIRRWGSAVVKPLYSSKARGMLVLETSMANWEETLCRFQSEGNSILYVQEKIPRVERDFGVTFVGGRYVGSYARVRGPAAWSTSVHAGGHYASAEPSQAALEVAARAQALFSLPVARVDVIESERGPLVLEVSAFGGFRGMSEAAGVNLAEAWVSSLFEPGGPLGRRT